jgi:hypothetical protein
VPGGGRAARGRKLEQVRIILILRMHEHLS